MPFITVSALLVADSGSHKHVYAQRRGYKAYCKVYNHNYTEMYRIYTKGLNYR